MFLLWSSQDLGSNDNGNADATNMSTEDEVHIVSLMTTNFKWLLCLTFFIFFQTRYDQVFGGINSPLQADTKAMDNDKDEVYINRLM